MGRSHNNSGQGINNGQRAIINNTSTGNTQVVVMVPPTSPGSSVASELSPPSTPQQIRSPSPPPITAASSSSSATSANPTPSATDFGMASSVFRYLPSFLGGSSTGVQQEPVPQQQGQPGPPPPVVSLPPPAPGPMFHRPVPHHHSSSFIPTNPLPPPPPETAPTSPSSLPLSSSDTNSGIRLLSGRYLLLEQAEPGFTVGIAGVSTSLKCVDVETRREFSCKVCTKDEATAIHSTCVCANDDITSHIAHGHKRFSP